MTILRPDFFKIPTFVAFYHHEINITCIMFKCAIYLLHEHMPMVSMLMLTGENAFPCFSMAHRKKLGRGTTSDQNQSFHPLVDGLFSS